jgi:hypothetical protein
MTRARTSTANDVLLSIVEMPQNVPRKPGAVISRLRAETRQLLSRLTSADVQDVPRWLFGDVAHIGRRGRMSRP